MAKLTTIYICQKCGATSPKWGGKCFECGAWNSLIEEVVESNTKSGKGSRTAAAINAMAASEVKELFALTEESGATERVPTGFVEMDRVLGGGFVPGSLLLFGGEPGIGKSTLLLQLLARLAAKGKRVLYISGEESGPQVASRALRLNLEKSDRLQFVSTTNLQEAIAAAEASRAEIVVADSVQTLQSLDLESAAGTVSQVREVCHAFMNLSKNKGVITLLVGHVTKDGTIAGPRLLEHMVDAVFYFELAASGGYRLLRANKNRFGATNELAVFEMSSLGLIEIHNPSARFLAERSVDMPGSAVIAHLEGSRPFMTEVQALVQRCYQGYPRRTVQGVDQNRISVLLAVIEKILDISFSERDVYCKVASGARVEEPAADLPLIFVLVSAALDKSIPSDVIMAGEVGLGGELRSVTGISSRLAEAKTVGLKRAFVPEWNAKEARETTGIQVIPVRNVRDVAKALGFVGRIAPAKRATPGDGEYPLDQ